MSDFSILGKDCREINHDLNPELQVERGPRQEISEQSVVINSRV